MPDHYALTVAARNCACVLCRWERGDDYEEALAIYLQARRLLRDDGPEHGAATILPDPPSPPEL